MAEIKEKHPTWFKMKAERRQLVRELPAETTAKVLLACWEYLETAEIPATLNPLERIAFSAFFPDLEESWRLYEQRIGTKIPPNNSERPSDTGRYHTMPHGTEPETEGRGESKEDSPSPALKNFQVTSGCTTTMIVHTKRQNTLRKKNWLSFPEGHSQRSENFKGGLRRYRN